MVRAREFLPIGKLAERTGLAVSAIRYYEDIGLLTAARNAGGQRRFPRSDIRRLSYILIAREFGFTLGEIKDQLDSLPDGRAPNKKDWTRMSRDFRRALDEKILIYQKMRDRLDGCIGCGCLSLTNCALYNPDDRARILGPGPRYARGDDPESEL